MFGAIIVVSILLSLFSTSGDVLYFYGYADWALDSAYVGIMCVFCYLSFLRVALQVPP